MSLADDIVNWIRERLEESGAKGMVVGLSGGVDSSLTCALAKKAVGKDKVLALILPCHSKIKDLQDAKFIAQKLNIKTKTIDLSKIYDNLIKILPKAGKIARANIIPRLRMLILYYFANKMNYLVCGSGNKSELMVGYFTKHGDGAADILPLGDLFKTQIRKLAKEIGIPDYIINKTPTAGLWPGQTDEGEMGISYPELDDILLRLEKRKKQVLPKEKVKKVKAMIWKSYHKSEGPKICQMKPKLTESRNFGTHKRKQKYVS